MRICNNRGSTAVLREDSLITYYLTCGAIEMHNAAIVWPNKRVLGEEDQLSDEERSEAFHAAVIEAMRVLKGVSNSSRNTLHEEPTSNKTDSSQPSAKQPRKLSRTAG